MNKLNVYTVLDTVAEAYHLPFYANNDWHAARLFHDALVKKGEISRPDEYRVVHIGYYDRDTGELEQCKHSTITLNDPSTKPDTE